MLSSIAIGFIFLSAAESPTITRISTLYGEPDQADHSFVVRCDKKIYSFKFRISRSEMTAEFDREPTKLSDQLSAEIVDAFRQFADIRSLKASCSASGADKDASSLALEITGPLRISDNEAFRNCLDRGGMYKDNSWRLMRISDDAVSIDGEEIGKCTTKTNIDEYQKMMRGSVK